jgi:hypothetical protein
MVTAGGLLILEAALRSMLPLLLNVLTTAHLAFPAFMSMAAAMKVNLLFILPAINNVLLISKNVEKFE